MALILADRVRETSTTTGTGALSLAGAVVGYQTFSSAIGNTNTCYYAISNPGVAEFEVGIGTYATSGNTLTRTTIIKSSNANAAGNFSAGTKDVVVTYPAELAVYLDASGNVTLTGTLTANTIGAFTLGGTVAGGGNSINNVIIGASSPLAGAFTTVTATSTAAALTVQGQPANGGTINIGDTAAYRGIISYDGNNPTTLTIANSYDTASAQVLIKTRTAGTPVTVATFSSTGLAVTGALSATGSNNNVARLTAPDLPSLDLYQSAQSNAAARNWKILTNYEAWGQLDIQVGTTSADAPSVTRLSLTSSGNLGIGMTPVNVLDITKTQNAASRANLLNSNASGAASAAYRATNGNANMEILMLGTGFTTAGVNTANTGVVSASFDLALSYGGGGAASLKFAYGSTEMMRLDSSGNLGLGVTPSAWSSGKAIEIGNAGNAVWNNGAAENHLTTNAYYNSGWKFGGTGYAQKLTSNTGQYQFNVSTVSGTAGNAITFTQAMTLSAAGGLSIGATADAGSGNILLPGTSGTIFGSATTGARSYIEMYNSSTGNMNIATTFSTAAITFSTGGTTTPTERARIDSSGKVGIGTATPNARLDLGDNYGASGEKFFLYNDNTSSALAGTKVGFYLDRFSLVNNTTFVFATAAANPGSFIFASKDTGGTTLVARMTILGQSDKVGIGNTAPTGNLHIGDGTTVAEQNLYVQSDSANRPYLRLWSGTSSKFELSIGSTADINSVNAIPIVFATTNTERMRIGSSGSLLVGNTATNTTVSNLILNGATRWGVGTQSGGNIFYIVRDSDGVGQYMVNGSTAWTAASDERLKDIIEPITDAANKVSTLRAVIGKFKKDAEGTRRSFLIAQDVQAVLPEAVTVQEDEFGTLGVQYTEVIPLLVAAIKEQQAIITALTTRITALEAK